MRHKRNPAQGGNWTFRLYDNSVSKDEPAESFSGPFSELPDAIRAAVSGRIFGSHGAVKEMPKEEPKQPQGSADAAILAALQSVAGAALDKRLKEANQ